MKDFMTLPTKGSLTSAKPKEQSNFPTFSSLFDDWFLGDMPSLFSTNFNEGLTMPKTNIRETDDAYYVDMAVPGLKKSDFKISLDNLLLSISAETKSENEDINDCYTRREFGYSSFKRSFTLPEYIDETKIKANYNDGILNVELPKKEEAKPKPTKTIEIS